MREALSTYARRDERHEFTKESLDIAFDAIGRVARVIRASENKPYLRRMYYIRGILRNRLYYLNERMVMGIMEEAIQAGADLDELENLAKQVTSWSQFRSALEVFIQDQQPTPVATPEQPSSEMPRS